jgi:3-isopropylmalate/(R)-2-methylmalate dehydratase small subunit
LEVNGINVVIGESFARIFRQNMFNCGILAVELAKADIDRLFSLVGHSSGVKISVDLEADKVLAESGPCGRLECFFTMNAFDKELVAAGGWLAYSDQKY